MKTSDRDLSVDLGRALAVGLMVIVHVADIFCPDNPNSGQIWNIVRESFGFVAPGFLFFSGLAISYALKKREEQKRSSLDLLLRAMLLVAIGFWMQLPSHSLDTTLNLSSASVERVFDSNILQVIGFSYALAILMTRLFSLRVVQALFLISGIAIISVAGLVEIHLESPLNLWVTEEGTIPLIPFSAYFFIGLGIRRVFLLKDRAIWIAILVPLAILLRYGSELEVFGNGIQYWDSKSLVHSFIATTTILTYVMLSFIRAESTNKTVSLVSKIGQVSLAVYIVHLVLLYGSPVSLGVQHLSIEEWTSPLVPVSVGAVTLAFSVLVGLGWKRFKEERRTIAKRIVQSAWIAFLILFVFS